LTNIAFPAFALNVMYYMVMFRIKRSNREKRTNAQVLMSFLKASELQWLHEWSIYH